MSRVSAPEGVCYSAAPMIATNPTQLAELHTLLASRAALIVLESREEARALDLVRQASLKARRGKNWGIFQWSATEGLLRLDLAKGGAQSTLADPALMLRHLKATPMAGIYVLLDFHPYLQDPVLVRTLKDVVLGYGQCARTLVLISHKVALPEELAYLAARFELALPDRHERRTTVMRIAREWTVQNLGQTLHAEPGIVDRLVDSLAGLPMHDVQRLAHNAIFSDGALTEADMNPVLEAKCQLLNKGGTLYFEPDTAQFADVGGMKNLRRWILSRKPAFDGTATGLDSPKGVLLLGVQGCGKSLAARAAAGVLGVPLVRLDFGALHSKWQGESEKNLRESLACAEALAPCVLWLDEIEKGLSSGDGDNGTSRRMLGSFLTWLAEARTGVFIVATANDISSLPPELVRKGRFDEMFFVDLPSPEARADILAIHCRKRSIPLLAADAPALIQHSEDFSGAEIEQAVVSALYSAHADKQPVTARHIARELMATRPLSVVLGEKIAELRTWAAGRTVPAD